MNILFIYDAPLRPEVGGTERATQLVMHELSQKGHRCLGILHFDQRNPSEQFLNNRKIASLYDFLKENQIEVVVNQIAFHPRFLSQFLAQGGERWKSEGGKIISFMHLDPTPAPKPALKSYFSDWKSKNLVAKLKRLAFVFSIPLFYAKTNREYNNGLRYLYEHSDRYVLMSQSFIPVFLKLTGLKDTTKVCVIPNMLTFPTIASDTIVNNKEKMLLVVARLDDEQKNISFILDAWNKVSNHHGYQLHIVGDGSDRDKLHAKASNMQDVVFEGAQSPLVWYQRAAIFLMASPREGWGLTITESLQNGVVPVVLNTSTVFKDIIVNQENGFLPNSMQEYVTCIESLLTDEALRQKMALKALASAHRFTPKVVGDLWNKMLQEFHV